MTRIKNVVLLLVVFLASAGEPCFAAESNRALELPAIFAAGMVLQRGEALPVWGWAKPGAEVSVAFNGQKKSTTANDQGTWQVSLDAMQALSVGAILTVVCGDESITINDVLVGEVWFCSGQSNMTVTLGFLSKSEVKEARYQPIVDFIDKEIETANDPLLRQFQVGIGMDAFEPADRGKGSWLASTSPQKNQAFCGTGYFFGKELRAKLDVPVGLIKCDYGGTLIEPWIPESGHKLFAPLWARYEKFMQDLRKKCAAWDSGETQKKYAEAMAKWEANDQKGHKPFDWGDPRKGALNRTILFNGMVHAVIPYGIKGVIWYQGESNSGANAAEYAVSFEAMVHGWREHWAKPELPFYMAQLASFEKNGEGRQWLTEAQRLAISKVDNTGLAVLNDVGETKDVHPKNKVDVGRRLALWALKKDYSIDVPAWSGPLYKSHETRGDHIVVTFDHAGTGLMVGRKNLLEEAKTVDESLPHFEICQFLGDWQPAVAELVGKDQVKVWSETVSEPQWLRYAWQADLDGTMLYNKQGLPASIFTSEPNVMDLALRSADRAALFHNLQDTYGITATAGTLTKPDGLHERITINGAALTVSSVFEDQTAQLAVDGDPKTGWASNGDRKKAWLMIPLGKKYRITHIGYQSRNGPWERLRSFRLDFGDGTMQLGYLDDKKKTGFQYYDIKDVETDVIRWSVQDTQYGTNIGAAEISVYGEPVE